MNMQLKILLYMSFGKHMNTFQLGKGVWDHGGTSFNTLLN